MPLELHVEVFLGVHQVDAFALVVFTLELHGVGCYLDVEWVIPILVVVHLIGRVDAKAVHEYVAAIYFDVFIQIQIGVGLELNAIDDDFLVKD